MLEKKTGAASDTKHRLLEAAESLFIKYGYDALLLRQITDHAKANLAAVNYHFGNKETLMKTLLVKRLEPLNERRLALLDECQVKCGGALSCEALLGILFAPAMELERSEGTGAENGAFIRFLGRVYSDTSPFIQQYLIEHYQPVFKRFFEAFAQALPELPRAELGVRLQFALKAISGVMAGTELRQLMNAMSLGRATTDAEVMAKLIALVSAAIRAPLQASDSEQALEFIMQTQREIHRRSAEADDAVGIGGRRAPRRRAMA